MTYWKETKRRKTKPHAMPSSKVIVREVWGFNLGYELKLVRQCLPRFSIASIDTEFPGNIFTTPIPFSRLSPAHLYSLMKRNVDSLKLIQLGLTLSDSDGNLPTLGTESHYVWQFNFSDFDPDHDRHDSEAIALLKKQGIDFVKNREAGIDSSTFALKFVEYGLGPGSGLSWVTFQGLYDYGYLIKILTGKQLPHDYEEFGMLKQAYFGSGIYDSKEMANKLGLYGGLEKISRRLKLDRVAGKSHQAGSDSLLTMHLFLELRKNFFPAQIIVVNKFTNQIMYCGMGFCPIPCSNPVPLTMH